MNHSRAILISAGLLITALAATGGYLLLSRSGPAHTLITKTPQAVVTDHAMGKNGFTLTSPVMSNGGALPAGLKCTRDGGDGLSPPINWANPPDGTKGYAIIMHHYPRGRVEGVDAPSHYWLLWNIPATIQGLERGNPTSIGDEGSDKDMRRTGYTPPCSPPGSPHQYTITVYALRAPLATLPNQDDGNVDWNQMIVAMDGLVLGSSTLTFNN